MTYTYGRWEANDWDFNPEDQDQVAEFYRRIESRLSEVEQRMLLCLINDEGGLLLLKSQLYK